MAIDWEQGESSGMVPLQAGNQQIFVSVYGPDREPGTPVVIVIPGVTNSITEWVAVRRLLQPTTRTLLYERSGMGASEQSPKCPTAANMALELDTLLRTLDIAPPYVIVCHSYGGIISREFVELRQKTEDVVGIVFVDANQEKSTILYPDSNLSAMRKGLDWYGVVGLSTARALTDPEWQAVLDEQATEKHKATATREMEYYVESCAVLGEKGQLDRDPPLLNSFPVSVLRGHPELDLGKSYNAGVLAGNGTAKQRHLAEEKLAVYPDTHGTLQREILKLSRKHRFVDLEDQGHCIHLTAPEAIVKEVTWVLQNVPESSG